MTEQPVILVTGASRGLGAAIARAAAERGARLVLSARSERTLGVEVQAILDSGGQALAVAADMSLPEDCRRLVEQSLATFGRLDGVVNNGGVIDPIAPLAEAEAQAWTYNWQVNLLGPVLLTQAAIPALRQTGGRVINISSGAAENVILSWGAYSTAKVALNHFTRILAAEEPALTALSVRPGLVDTRMQAEIRQKGQEKMAAKDYHRLAGAYEKGRLLPPELPGRAIAGLALFAPHEWSGDFLAWDDERVQALLQAH